MANTKRSGNAVIALESVEMIRHALIVGLAAYGEIERLVNEQAILESCGIGMPEGMRVVHPTGSPVTVSEFATALALLDSATAPSA